MFWYDMLDDPADAARRPFPPRPSGRAQTDLYDHAAQRDRVILSLLAESMHATRHDVYPTRGRPDHRSTP